jgi:hypothetical protein
VRPLLAALAVCASLLALAAAAWAEDPARQEFVDRAEPICLAASEANHNIFDGLRKQMKDRRYAAAGRRFVRASRAFGRATAQLAALPRPPGYEARLEKWIAHLRLVRDDLRNIGLNLKKGDRLQANYESVRLRSASNAANNVVWQFDFRYCHLTSSRFFG